MHSESCIEGCKEQGNYELHPENLQSQAQCPTLYMYVATSMYMEAQPTSSSGNSPRPAPRPSSMQISWTVLESTWQLVDIDLHSPGARAAMRPWIWRIAPGASRSSATPWTREIAPPSTASSWSWRRDGSLPVLKARRGWLSRAGIDPRPEFRNEASSLNLI